MRPFILSVGYPLLYPQFSKKNVSNSNSNLDITHQCFYHAPAIKTNRHIPLPRLRISNFILEIQFEANISVSG